MIFLFRSSNYLIINQASANVIETKVDDVCLIQTQASLKDKPIAEDLYNECVDRCVEGELIDIDTSAGTWSYRTTAALGKVFFVFFRFLCCTDARSSFSRFS